MENINSNTFQLDWIFFNKYLWYILGNGYVVRRKQTEFPDFIELIFQEKLIDWMLLDQILQKYNDGQTT